MRFDAIVVAVVYNHFLKMKENGRKIVPWFQTASVLSFWVIIFFLLFGLILVNIISPGKADMTINEVSFVGLFIASIAIVFFLIKKSYFDSNKHINFLETFKSFSAEKQKRSSVIVLSILCVLPFVLIYFLYLVRG